MFEILSKFLISNQEKESEYLLINKYYYKNEHCHYLRYLYIFKYWKICCWIYWNKNKINYKFLFKIQLNNLAFEVIKYDKISDIIKVIINDNFITKCHKLC